MFDRNDRLTSLFRELAASFIRTEANTPPLITVTGATVSSDFSHATIFVTVYPENDEEHALNFLKRKGGDFRGYAKRNAKLKIIPFFDFKIDVGEKHRRHFESIEKELSSEEEKENT